MQLCSFGRPPLSIISRLVASAVSALFHLEPSSHPPLTADCNRRCIPSKLFLPHLRTQIQHALLPPSSPRHQCPKSNGQHSHAIRSDYMLYLAGWMGDDHATGQSHSGDNEAQTSGRFSALELYLTGRSVSQRSHLP